jgi:hypothetical protein
MCPSRTGQGEEAAVAHDYSIELGFDFDSEQKDPSYDGFLEMGCAEGNSLASLDQLKKDGGLTFIVYDVSDSPHAGTGVPQTLNVTFARADESSTSTSPFATNTLTFTAFHDRGNKGSSEFGNRPSWYAQSGAQVGTDNKTTIPFVNNGNFFVTVALTVTFTDPDNPTNPVTKTFGQDPRMDVDT